MDLKLLAEKYSGQYYAFHNTLSEERKEKVKLIKENKCFDKGSIDWYNRSILEISRKAEQAYEEALIQKNKLNKNK